MVDDSSIPDWGSPTELADDSRKVFACQRVLAVSRELTGRKLPVRGHMDGPLPKGTEVMPLSVFEEFGRATKFFDACLQLAMAGYGQPAQVLATQVTESAFIVLWAIEKGEDVDHQADLHARYGHRVEVVEDHRLEMKGASEDEAPLTELELAEALALFGSTPEALWTGHAATEALIDEVVSLQEDPFVRKQLERLKLELSRAESMRRGTGMAQHSLREVRELNGQKALAVNFGPSTYGVSAALHLAGAAYLTAVDLLVMHYAPELADQVRAAEGLIWRAWKDPTELSGLSDTDACPCDRPDTVWATCHKWTETLGTTTYTPITDADLVHFTPFDPSSLRREPPKEDESAQPGVDFPFPNGPHIVTFTFTLPFALGLEDTVAYALSMRNDKWADPNDVAHFGQRARIRIRFHKEQLKSPGLWLGDPSSALRAFFGETPEAKNVDASLPPIRSYEQWVTLDTPGARLASEDLNDRAYAFHRCLAALNSFLTAMDLAVSDQQISTVTTQQLGPIVFIGAWTRNGGWRRLGALMMHPEGWPVSLSPVPFETIRPQVEGILGDLMWGRPFMVSHLWHGRAQRALRVRGDTSDGVVSLQTAVESMMYDMLRSLLVDEGKDSSQVGAAVSAERSFKSLLTREFHWRLGGNWNLIGEEPVARYWQNLYELRNRIVHAGYTPGANEADQALKAFFELREFTNERLRFCRSRYPRTLLAKVGTNGLVRRGWMTKEMKEACAGFTQEPRPFYLPWDIAGRPGVKPPTSPPGEVPSQLGGGR